MSPDNNPAVEETVTTEVITGEPPTTDLGIEQITHLLILQKLSSLKEQFATKGLELKQRQDKVRWVHDLMQRLNKRVDKETGVLDLTHKKIDETTGELKAGESAEGDQELQGLLEVRRRLKEAAGDRGYEVKAQGSYTKDERERMIENLRMVCDDLNLQNDLQLQDLNQLVNERYEVYQMARAVFKPLHDDKLHKARSVSGR
jgi:hypothetical protein